MAKKKTEAGVAVAPAPIEAPTTQTGNFVLRTQKTAKEAGFSRVSQLWYDKTNDYDWAFEQLAKYNTQTEDVHATLGEMTPGVSAAGKFVMRYQDGREFEPTPYALKKIAYWYVRSQTIGSDVLKLHVNEDDEHQYEYLGDHIDSEAYVQVLKAAGRDLDPEKKYLFRLNTENNTLRAMLSSDQNKSRGAKFAAIDNRLVLEWFKEMIPDGRVSHWAGNPDSILGNILVPDEAMSNNGHDYGGGISFSNSEIGERIFAAYPFLFVAICMNGCIWDKKCGEMFEQVHKGKIDLDAVRLVLQNSITVQLDLVPTAINQMLATREMKWDKISPELMFAQAGHQFGMTKGMLESVFNQYGVETDVNPANENTLYGIINSLTRSAHDYKNVAWDKLSTSAGNLIRFDKGDWDDFKRSAKNLKPNKIKKYFPEMVS